MAIQTQTTGRLPKPELRGYTSRYLRKHVLIALSLGFVSSMAYKFLVAEPRKKRYAEFYRFVSNSL